MFYRLPPVGTPVSLRAREADLTAFKTLVEPYCPVFYDSGTAALAAALTAACRLKQVSDPEVLIPAYACPDLVSAVEYAGATPVLVDLEADRPWMDLDQVSACLTANSVAIVAVHLFGILERMPALKKLARDAGVVLVEDSAQAFPGGQEENFWSADLVVLSFGRGKPVNALGGGALLVRHARLSRLLPVLRRVPQGFGKTQKSILKIIAYNLLVKPRIYWLPDSLPLLHLGETRYRRLQGIHGLSRRAVRSVASNVARYRKDGLQRQTAIRTALDIISERSVTCLDLPAACGQAVNRRLLRYPLLIDVSLRDACLRALSAAGLGATAMYPASLPGIAGLEHRFSGSRPVVEAERFATRIVTLPVHPGVGDDDIKAMMHILQTLH